MCRVLSGDKKKLFAFFASFAAKKSNLKPQTDRAFFKSHAERRRRGGSENVSTLKLRGSASPREVKSAEENVFTNFVRRDRPRLFQIN